MIGPALAYLLAQFTAYIRRQTAIYGLIATGALLAVFAAGYGLDAIRESLSVRLGGTYASLIVAGGLLALAGIAVVTAIVLGRAKKAVHAAPSIPLPNLPPRPTVTSAAILTGGAVTGLIAGVLAAKRPWRSESRVKALGEPRRRNSTKR